MTPKVTVIILIFILMLHPEKYSTMSKTNDIQSGNGTKSLSLTMQVPDEILTGEDCSIQVSLRNVSSKPILINKRMAVGYPRSLSRELYLIICRENSSVDVGRQKVLYQRNFPQPADYQVLQAGQTISSSFELFDWYEFPGSGTYTVQLCYQADEALAAKPEGICAGVFCSALKTVTFASE